MSIGDEIKKARKNEALTLKELSQFAGISSEYLFDIENYDDELLTNTALLTLKKLCQRLSIDPYAMLVANGLANGNGVREGAFNANALGIAREALSISLADLADKIGFEETLLDQIDKDVKACDALPVGVCLELMGILNLSPAVLFHQESEQA
jgi:transcriptional regulator with XRE-family HTH domain